jgi:lysophospholipid acyltransferase (LPLAT)-like uncharacterized protein
MKKQLILTALRSFLWRAAKWWASSLTVITVNAAPFDALRKSRKNYVIAFWHGSMFVGWFLHRPLHGTPVSALVSQSKDGEYLSTVLERWGYTMIRGSSHIGGKEAMQLMVDALNNGSALAITPDGPRGPRHEMKMGAVRAAQRALVPLVTAGIAMEQKRLLRSWDRFEVPMPFSRVAVVYSDPVMVDPTLHGEPLDTFKMEMETKLRTLTAEAEHMLESKGHRP